METGSRPHPRFKSLSRGELLETQRRSKSRHSLHERKPNENYKLPRKTTPATSPKFLHKLCSLLPFEGAQLNHGQNNSSKVPISSLIPTPCSLFPDP